MWLAFWRLSPISCFWLGSILWKPCHGAIWRLTLKKLFFLQKTYTDNNSESPLMLQQWRPRLFIQEKITQDLRCLIFLAFSGPSQAHNLTNIVYMNVFSDMNTGSGIQLWIFLVGCHPSDSHLAIQPVDYVSDWHVASLLAPEFILQKYTDNNSTQKGCSNEGHGFFHSRKHISRCLEKCFCMFRSKSST